MLISDVPAQEVESTLHPGLTACPGDRLTFICKTRDSDSLIWSSDEYVNGQSTQLNFTAHDTPGLLLMLDDTVAALVSVSQENGVLEITCNLTITVLPSIGQHSHSVTCANSDIGTRNVTTFGLAGIHQLDVYSKLCCEHASDATTFTYVRGPLTYHHVLTFWSVLYYDIVVYMYMTVLSYMALK